MPLLPIQHYNMPNFLALGQALPFSELSFFTILISIFAPSLFYFQIKVIKWIITKVILWEANRRLSLLCDVEGMMRKNENREEEGSTAANQRDTAARLSFASGVNVIM